MGLAVAGGARECAEKDVVVITVEERRPGMRSKIGYLFKGTAATEAIAVEEFVPSLCPVRPGVGHPPWGMCAGAGNSAIPFSPHFHASPLDSSHSKSGSPGEGLAGQAPIFGGEGGTQGSGLLMTGDGARGGTGATCEHRATMRKGKRREFSLTQS